MASSGDRPGLLPGSRGYRPPGRDDPPTGGEKPAEYKIDLPLLAAKVVALLKEELRVERERLGRSRR
jgi:hypothetical protein